MPDTKITALTAIGANPIIPATFPIPMVDLTDTSMAASGTTKKVTVNQILGSGGTATLASATITGDLTVDTSTLKVDSANDRVGIGIATPAWPLDIRSATAVAQILSTTGTNAAYLQVSNTGGIFYLGRENSAGTSFASPAYSAVLYAGGAYPLVTTVNGSERYRIASDGVATWSNVGGVAGTAMTLNSTGLGVGTASPAATIHGYSASGSAQLRMQNGTAVTGRTWYFNSFSDGNLYIGIPTVIDALTVTPTGNVGIGVAPSAWSGTGVKVIDVGAAGSFAGSAADVGVVGNAYYNGSSWIYKTSFFSGRYAYALGTGQHQWFTAPSGTAGNAITFTQAMTLDASGNLFIGKTATGLGTVGIQASPSGWFQATVSGDASLFTNRLASDGKTVQLYRQTLEVGNISVTTTGATFNSTSDYRLKEAVAPLSGGLARVNALKPSVYKWKSNGLSGEGFLAHELADVVPAAVNGEKDAVNEDGSINAQSIDMSRVVPILVAAIQELTARVQTLEAK